MCVWMRSMGTLAVTTLCLTALCLTFVGCGGPPSTDKAAAPPAAEQRYDLKGTVVSLDKPGAKLTVNHEEIKGFMAAMTMAYPVKDARALDGVDAGDTVTAKLVSNGESYWLEDVKVVEHAKK